MSTTTSVNSLKTNFLSHILPYDSSTKKNGNLQTALKEYQLLVNVAQEVSKVLENGNLKRFDALVGENACEVRAAKIALTVSNLFTNIKKLNVRIEQVQKQITELLSPKKIASLMKNGDSLKDVIEKENLEISLTEEEAFAIQSFILSEMRVNTKEEDSMPSLCKNAVADPKQLKQYGSSVSSNFTDSLVRVGRKSLATASVQFIREKASTLKDQSLVKMASEDFTIAHNSWPCTPMFWTYKTILKVLEKEQIPIIMHAKFLDKIDEGYKLVDEEYLLFQYNSDSNQYEEKILQQSDLSKAAFMVQGAVCPDKEGKLISKEKWKAVIKNTSIDDVILAGAADHRQYPDEKQDLLVEKLNDVEFETYKQVARKEGFSLENPSLFFIQHVYPTQIGNITQLAKSSE